MPQRDRKRPAKHPPTVFFTYTDEAPAWQRAEWDRERSRFSGRSEDQRAPCPPVEFGASGLCLPWPPSKGSRS